MTLNAGISAGHPQWSYDGRRIVYTRFRENVGGELMTIGPDGGNERSVTLLGTGVSGGHAQWLAETIYYRDPPADRYNFSK